jgi:hypothetical protein
MAINKDRFESRLATLYLEIPAGRCMLRVIGETNRGENSLGDLRWRYTREAEEWRDDNSGQGPLPIYTSK